MTTNRTPQIGEVWTEGPFSYACLSVADAYRRYAWLRDDNILVVTHAMDMTPPPVLLPEWITQRPWRAVFSGTEGLSMVCYAAAEDAMKHRASAPSVIVGALNIVTGEWVPK